MKHIINHFPYLGCVVLVLTSDLTFESLFTIESFYLVRKASDSLKSTLNETIFVYERSTDPWLFFILEKHFDHMGILILLTKRMEIVKFLLI